MSKIFLLITFILISLTTLLLILRWDRRQPEPWKNLLFCFFIGFVAFLTERFVFRFAVCKMFFGSDLIEFTVRINDEFVSWKDNPAYGSLNRLLFSAYVVGGLLKEGLKFFFLGYCLNKFRKDVDEPRDPIVYAMIIAFSFALFDSFFHYYVDLYPLRSVGGTFDYFRFNLFWVIARLFTVHFAGAMAAGLGYALSWHNYETSDALRFRIPFLQNRRKLYVPLGFFMAVLIHGTTTLSFGARQWGWVMLGFSLVVLEILVMWEVMRRFKKEA